MAEDGPDWNWECLGGSEAKSYQRLTDISVASFRMWI